MEGWSISCLYTQMIFCYVSDPGTSFQDQNLPADPGSISGYKLNLSKSKLMPCWQSGLGVCQSLYSSKKSVCVV